MALFMIQADDMTEYVEAATMIAAIQIWRAHVQGESDFDPEPEQVHLVHDEPVIRDVIRTPKE